MNVDLNQTLIETIGQVMTAPNRDAACAVIARRAAVRGYGNVIICNSEHALHHCDVPDGWFDHYFTERLHESDLMLRAMKSLHAPHYWNDVPAMLDASKGETDFVSESQSAGLRDGISISAFMCGQPLITTFSARDSGVDHVGALEEFTALMGVYGMMQSKFDLPNDYGLTPTELDLLKWLASSFTVEDIADQRCRSTDTIKSQVKSIYAKLREYEPGINSRTTLMAFCVQRGLLTLDDL